MKYELWIQDETEQPFCLAGPHGDNARRLLEPRAKLVWTCEAPSHFAAMTKYYEYLGWGEYNSEFLEEDKKSYSELDWK